MQRRRAIVISLLLIAAVVGVFVARIVWIGGAFRTIEPHFAGHDNIEVAAAGDLWIGAHPKLLLLNSIRDHPAALAPSQVLRVSRDGNGYRVDEVYLNAGDQIAAASVAAVRGQRLLIGQIFGNGILDCVMQ